MEAPKSIKRSGYLAIASTAALIFMLVWCSYHEQQQTIEKLQKGELFLECHMKDGVKLINPSKIQSFDDHGWTFTNGYASNCRIIKSY